MKYLASIFIILSLIASPAFAGEPTAPPAGSALRQNILGNLGTASGSLQTEGSSSDNALVNSIGGIVKVFLSLLGIIIVLLFIYGGFMWMTAAGDDKKVTKAKDTIRNAVIGLVIILTSYAVASFVLDQLSSATTSVSESGTPQGCSSNADCSGLSCPNNRQPYCFNDTCACS